MSTTKHDKVQTLRALIRLLTDASEVIIREWESEKLAPSGDGDFSSFVPSAELFDAQRTVIGACGMCTDIVQEPQSRLMEMATGYYLARAIHIAAEARIADVLAHADPKQGVPIDKIAKQVGVEDQKLARVLRCLCSNHIFVEVKNLHFANSPTSRCLVGNEPLRCWLLTHALDIYTASEKLPAVLFDPVKTRSHSSRETAFQEAHQTDLTFWEFFEQGAGQSDRFEQSRSGLEIFGIAMVGGGRVHAPPLHVDYPWGALGSATVVDVGSGVGGMSLDLARIFPNLHFVLQDRAPVIAQAVSVWQREMPKAVETGRIKMMPHNFFEEQPIQNAEVYLMRYVLHDWPDEECVTILKHLRNSLGPNSRILTADQVIHTTVGSAYLKAAPAPLPANYGCAHRLAHQRDLNMLTLFNGMERTPEQLSLLAEQAGLRVVKVWECRGMVSITEMRRDDHVTSDE